MSVINIGVMGCANVAERLVIPAIKGLPDQFHLEAVASRSVAKAKCFADQFDCSAYDSYEKLLHDDNIAALYIPLPTGLHAQWIMRALEMGKHVYAEKSIAATFAQAQVMVKAARKYDLALMEGYMFQYHKQHQHIKQIVRSGIIGEIRHFASSFGFPPLDPANFRYDKNIGGGALLDAAGYTVRAAFFLLERDLEVQGATMHYDSNGTSMYGSAFLADRNGLGAAVSFGFDNAYQCNYQLWGSKGKLTANKAFTPKPNQVPTFTLETNNDQEIIQSFPDDHFARAMQEFHSIIHQDSKRTKHFSEILSQSKALNDIEDLAR
ncbi:MAG: Gfo/Idh/MocA family oxidoreductase [Gammaproteobacteria bacterium]|nr:Gfo/Idh/MocA family oxidoreductase [Gammaproteobacteria bacterium]